MPLSGVHFSKTVSLCSYKFDTPFEREIKSEVFKIVRRGREFGTFGWFARAFAYVGLFFGLQYLWVTQETSYMLAIIYGIAQAFIGLNVQHDANHGAASKTPWVNNLFGLGADFIGGSKWLWMEQHWTVRLVESETFSSTHQIPTYIFSISISFVAPFLHQPQREGSRQFWSRTHASFQRLRAKPSQAFFPS